MSPSKAFFIRKCRDFPGSPVVKTSPSNAGVADSIPGQGAKIPHASGPKKQNIKKPPKNRSSIVTNSIKTLKISTSKKSLKKNPENADKVSSFLSGGEERHKRKITTLTSTTKGAVHGTMRTYERGTWSG